MTDPLAPGQVAFHDDDRPAFPPGPYQIKAAQQLSVATDKYFDQPTVQDFEVRGPQFAIDAGEVSARFPPAEAVGDFSDVLPHVVLTEPTLPWERIIRGTPAGTPWLALLVLDDSEIVSANTVTVAELLRADPGVTKPAIDPSSVSAAVLASQTTALVVTAEVFQALAPQVTELPYLAHVRTANLSGQDSGGAAEQGTFSVVVSARFPDSAAPEGTGGTRNRVHLVSLEGLGPLLAAAAAESGASDRPDSVFGAKPGTGKRPDVALASLVSWSFTSAKAADGTFAGLMGNLISAAGGDAGRLLLRAPVPAASPNLTPAQQAARDRLADGYVPLVYATATGEESFAWYRGPGTPVVPQPLPAKPPPGRYTSADQAVIYVEADGIFDLSYAAAWTLGRALGLSDRSFATALYGFRRTVHQLVDLALSRIQVLGPPAGLAPAGRPAAPAGAIDLAAFADLSPLVAANPVITHFGTLVGAGIGGTVQGAVTALSATTGANAPTIAPAPPAPPPAPMTQVKAFLGQQAGLDLISEAARSAASDHLAAVAGRLARLLRLEGVPFTHLVSDQALLPAESIRFFYLDPGWTGALVDGALSVAVESSRDVYVQEAFDAIIKEAVTEALGEGGTPVAGLLLRSAAVAGWPGMTVTAQAKGAAVPIPVITHPSSNVLLCLFAGVPDTIRLAEPAHGLRFGAQDGPVLELRSPVPPVGKPLADPRFPASGDLTQYFRPAPTGVPGRVLSISALVPALSKRLGGRPVGAADLAVQLVLAPEQLSFSPAAGRGSDR
jgi:hypothetical protein